MNTYVVLVAVVAVLAKSTSAGCIGGPVLFPAAPVLSPIIPAPCISAPFLSAPIYPSTTIVQTNSVTESLVDVLQMLPVVNLLNNQLCPNVLAAPILPCGCGLGCGCGCGCGCGTYYI